MSKLCFVVGAIALGTSAFAQINYNNFTGTTVRYLQVTESSGTDTLPLFGQPTVTGDSIAFNPTFGAFAANGSTDITDGQIAMGVESITGGPITGFSIAERGDYRFVGNNATAATSATVSLTLFVRITQINGVNIAPIPMPVISGVFNPSNGAFNAAANPTPFVNGLWNGNGFVDIAAFAAANNITGTITGIQIALDNTLTCTSETGTISFIRKKEFGGVAITVVPTPGAAGLLGVGLFAVSRRRR